MLVTNDYSDKVYANMKKKIVTEGFSEIARCISAYPEVICQHNSVFVLRLLTLVKNELSA